MEVTKASGPKAKIKKWKRLRNRRITQAAYRKKKKDSSEKAKGQRFNFGSSMRAVENGMITFTPLLKTNI
ncbi:hypothetical protein [Maridesulfovibrio frigidus]|uniref:hypothetical protein n=1 Tax=Maridesulfovibrio frigidus TaxID=340956 RepID=UPI0004E1FE1C|nr:hypothetical protein [Maridesulfovibrio frigidus]